MCCEDVHKNFKKIEMPCISAIKNLRIHIVLILQCCFRGYDRLLSNDKDFSRGLWQLSPD